MIKFHSEEKQSGTQHGFGLHQFMSKDLMRGVRFRVWDVEANNIQYQYNAGHTLSLYLKGGERTFRKDKPHLKGQTGKLCLMPQDHLSRWHSPEAIRIAHLYLPDQIIRQEAERHLDIDSRLANLQDLVYQSDVNLSNAMMNLIAAMNSGSNIDSIFVEQALHTVTAGLLERYCDLSKPIKMRQYGLSPTHRTLIKSYIKSHLGQKLTLEDLAAKLQLSPFHFARMFKQSFGDSPAKYVIRQRVELAKTLLAGKEDSSFVALECGFCHQSHFINHFKKEVGVTPAKYRNILHN
jgi:AraC family transcriptional regulator